jgi:hypothetical protein
VLAYNIILLTYKNHNFMKKQLTLFFCCLAALTLGVAQPQMQKTENGKRKAEFSEKLSKEKIKPVLPLKQNSHPKSVDWYEPDTVYIYLAGYDVSTNRAIWSYENGNCATFFRQEQVAQNQWFDTHKEINTYNAQNNLIEKIEGYFGGEWFLSKHIYTYDMQNNVTEQLSQSWVSEEWINNYKNTYSYDTQNNLTEYLGQTWESGQWVNEYKEIKAYDAQNNLIEFIYQYKDWETGILVNGGKVIYSYDTNNNLIEELDHSWESGEWINMNKWTNTYDANNNLIEAIRQNRDWETGEMTINGIMTYTYDAQNNLTEYISQQRDWQTGNLINDFKENFTYNTQNILTERVRYHDSNYDGEETGQWIHDQTETYIFDTQNNLITYKNECLDWYKGEWYVQYLYSYAYDTHNNLTEEIFQGWNWDLWQQTAPVKITYTYDENNNAVLGVCQLWENNIWVDVNDVPIVYYNNMQSYKGIAPVGIGCNKFTASYVKTGTVSVKENTPKVTVKLYPNPTSGILNIETGNSDVLPEVKIYSIQGALLINTQGNKIDISSLPNGVYIANISGQTLKVVKQ